MITKIIAQLKTGKIKQVIPFGNETPAEAPYIVVKQEGGTGSTTFRVNVHMLKGQSLFLEDYVRNDLAVLLSDFSASSRHGNFNMLYTDDFESLPNLVTNNDDKTISMDRLFTMPDKWFP